MRLGFGSPSHANAVAMMAIVCAACGGTVARSPAGLEMSGAVGTVGDELSLRAEIATTESPGALSQEPRMVEAAPPPHVTARGARRPAQ